MGFSISRVAFTYMNNTIGSTSIASGTCLAYTLWNDMIANGFTLVDSDTYTGTGTNLVPAITTKTTSVILKPTVAVDPLIANQSWVVSMRLLDGGSWPSYRAINNSNMSTAGIRVGGTTNAPVVQQFPQSGLSIAIIPTTVIDTALKISDAKISNAQYLPIVPPLTGNSYDPTPRIFPGRPYGYLLTIVPRGFALNVYDTTSTENIQLQGTICVQRAMACSGTYVSTGNTPLYMVTNVSPVYNDAQSSNTSGINGLPGPQCCWYSQIVRESGVSTTLPVFNDAVPSANNGFYQDNDVPYTFNTLTTNISNPREQLGNILHRFPMTWRAPVTGDTGEYILVFPFGVCSNRFAYTDELDLIAVSKADAYQSGQNIPITVYGDTRQYTALSSNNAQYGNNGGVRVFILSGSSQI